MKTPNTIFTIRLRDQKQYNSFPYAYSSILLEPAVHGRGAEGNCFVNLGRLEAFELSFMNPYKEYLKSVGGKVKFK